MLVLFPGRARLGTAPASASCAIPHRSSRLWARIREEEVVRQDGRDERQPSEGGRWWNLTSGDCPAKERGCQHAALGGRRGTGRRGQERKRTGSKSKVRSQKARGKTAEERREEASQNAKCKIAAEALRMLESIHFHVQESLEARGRESNAARQRMKDEGGKLKAGNGQRRIQKPETRIQNCGRGGDNHGWTLMNTDLRSARNLQCQTGAAEAKSEVRDQNARTRGQSHGALASNSARDSPRLCGHVRVLR
jgi:hypothetical protein